MKNNIKSKIIVPHVKGCKSIWSGIIQPASPDNIHYWGNFNANPNASRGRYHIWFKVMCNNPDCPGIKAVHSSVLENA